MSVVTVSVFNFGRKQLSEEDYVSVGHCECVKLLPMLHLWSVKMIPALSYECEKVCRYHGEDELTSAWHVRSETRDLTSNTEPAASTCWASIISHPKNLQPLQHSAPCVTGDWMDVLWLCVLLQQLLISLLHASHSHFIEELLSTSSRSVYCQVECSITRSMSLPLAAGLPVHSELSLTFLLYEYKESRSRIFTASLMDVMSLWSNKSKYHM